MALQLFAHPFSSYCQKALIALYENELHFDLKLLGPDDQVTQDEFTRRWPLRKMPLLVDSERQVHEASIIVEYLDLHYPGRARLLPEDRDSALEVRTLDRFFDNYVMTPMQKIVFDCMRAPDLRDPAGVEDAHALLERSYEWLDGHLAGREWACGDFGLADCAAAPSLFYADWVHPIAPELGEVKKYRDRLLTRPSFARAVDEARPYRYFFPPGAPDRD